MNQPLGINKIIFCDTSTSDFYLIFIWSADYFLSCAHPKRKQPWLTKNFGVRLGKRHYACEVYNPRVMILDICSIIYKSNDPQISHLQNVLWVYKLFMRLGTCFETISGMHPYAWMAPAATVGFIFNVICTFSKKSEWSIAKTSTSYSRGTGFEPHV